MGEIYILSEKKQGIKQYLYSMIIYPYMQKYTFLAVFMDDMH